MFFLLGRVKYFAIFFFSVCGSLQCIYNVTKAVQAMEKLPAVVDSIMVVGVLT